MWLSQASLAGLDLPTLTLAAGTVTTIVTGLGGLLLKVWAERVKAAEAKANKLADDIVKGKDLEIAFWKGEFLRESTEKDALLNAKAKNFDDILTAISNLRAAKGQTEPPRKDSPMPHTGYSISTTNPKKTPPSRLR